MIVDKYVERRFSDAVPSKPQFAEYMYAHWQGAKSGERALAALLRPGAVAKAPLHPRLLALRNDLPLLFVYG